MASQNWFSGCKALFVKCGISPGRLAIFKKRFQEKGGLLTGFTVAEMTHVIAGSAEGCAERFGSMDMPGPLEQMRELKHFVTYEWLTASLIEGKVAAENKFPLFLDPEAENLKLKQAKEKQEQEDEDRYIEKICRSLRRANPGTP